MCGAANSTLMTWSVLLEKEIGYVLLTSTTENDRAKPTIVIPLSPLLRISKHNNKQYVKSKWWGEGRKTGYWNTLNIR